MKLRTGTKIVLVVLALGAAAFWYGYIDRAYATLDKDGWHLEFSYVRLACRTCSGRIEKLEYAGRSLGTPILEGKNLPSIWINTPVGMFKWFSEFKVLRFEHYQSEVTDVALCITDDELIRGYYDLDFVPASTQPYTLPRKSGTPAGWCLAFTDNGNYLRWLDPEELDKQKW